MKKTSLILLLLSLGCNPNKTGRESDSNYSPDSLDHNRESQADLEIVYQGLPKDCYRNPIINCMGASLGNFLNAYYLVGDFNVFYAFLDNDSKRRFKKSDLEKWFSRIEFGYQIDFTNRINELGNYGELVYTTDINNTRGRLILPYIIENDSAKLKLSNISNDINNQIDRNIETKLRAVQSIQDAVQKLGDSSHSANPTSITIRLTEALHFQSGEYLLSKKGEILLKEISHVVLKKNIAIAEILCIGYTDSDRIKPGAFHYRDNLDLSALRASSVATALSRELKLPLSQFQVIGKGELPNLEKVEKSSSRRVEITLLL